MWLLFTTEIGEIPLSLPKSAPQIPLFCQFCLHVFDHSKLEMLTPIDCFLTFHTGYSSLKTLPGAHVVALLGRLLLGSQHNLHRFSSW